MADPHGLLRRTARRVGRRGCTLLFLAILDMLYAYNLHVTAASLLAPVHLGFPAGVWALIWLAAGLTCLLSVPARVDRVAFTANVMLLLAWGLIYAVAWLHGTVPRGWVNAVIWIALAGLIVVISTWPESVAMTLLRADADANGDAVVHADEDGRIQVWDGDAEQIFGWQASEVVGRPLTILMAERHRADHEAAIVRLGMTGKTTLTGRTLHGWAVHRDGTEFPVRVTIGIRDVDGAREFVGLIHRDSP